MKLLIDYNPVIGMFVVNDDETKAKLAAARKALGEDAWKRGFNPKAVDLARDAGVKGVKLSGTLNGVYYAENTHGANTYRKLRLVIENEQDLFTVSLELDSEISMRLIQLLENVTAGAMVELTATQEVVNRDGVAYCNHVPSLKADAKIVYPRTGRWKAAQAQGDTARDALKAVVKDAKLLNAAAAGAKVTYHRNLLELIEKRFAAARTPA
jgi:hypothetical protein